MLKTDLSDKKVMVAELSHLKDSAGKNIWELINSAPVGFIMIDKKKSIKLINKTFCSFFHLDENQSFAGKSIYNLLELMTLGPHDIAQIKALLDFSITLEEPEQMDLMLNYNDGKPIFYRTVICPLETKNNGRILIFYDITKAKEKELSPLDVISALGHDLKNPLAAIIGFSDLIQDGIAGELTPMQEDYLDKIQLQGQKLIKLINDMLDFSKLEAGKMPMYYQTVSIEETIKDILDSISPVFNGTKITLLTYIDPDLPKIEVDVDKLRQIILNLLDNSIKFTDAETGKITISIHKKDDKYLSINVEDNGSGIPAELLPKVLEPRREKKKDNKAGAGLGLTITKRLVELHGGNISVESSYLGTKVTFNIPVSRN